MTTFLSSRGRAIGSRACLQTSGAPGLRGAFPRRRSARTAGWSATTSSRVVEARIDCGEPALVYGHPERRLGRMPEVLIALHRALAESVSGLAGHHDGIGPVVALAIQPQVHGLPREEQPFEIQFDEWDTEYPLAVEIQRGCFCCSLPLTSSRTVAAARGAGLRAARSPQGPGRRGSLDRPSPSGSEGRRPQGARLGDGDAAARVSAASLCRPRQEGTAMVEAPASGDGLMTPITVQAEDLEHRPACRG